MPIRGTQVLGGLTNTTDILQTSAGVDASMDPIHDVIIIGAGKPFDFDIHYTCLCPVS